MNVGFKPQPGTGELLLQADQLTRAKLPDWVHIHCQENAAKEYTE
jgi:hypothetical protein